MSIKKYLVVGTVVTGLAVGTGMSVTAQKPDFNPVKAQRNVGQTKEQLLQYKQGTHDKLNKLAQQIAAKNNGQSQEKLFVTVTLNKPLNEHQLNKLVSQYHMDVQHTLVRSISKDPADGKRGTLVAAPGATEDDLQLSLDNVQHKFKGFIEIVANVPVDQIEALEQDKQVFLVDGSGDPYFVSNPKKKYMPGVFWNLEDYKIVTE